MEVCNDTYFDGMCQTLEQEDISGRNFTIGEIRSVSCTCMRECKCTDIHMKKSSCARGYLKGGCKTCNSLYFELIGQHQYVPDEIIGNIEAIRVRKGCALTVFTDEEFQGDVVIFDDEVIEEYNDALAFQSYKCQCSDVAYEPPVHQPRPVSFPPLIPIPIKLEDLVKILSIQEYSAHPGLLAGYESLKNNKSPRNAYILLLGSTGAGKTSAMKLLFDNPNLTKAVDQSKSTNSEIHEYRIPVPVDELGIGNSELRIIDTPGLGDTRGLEQDAKFLATLDDFLAGHEELKNRTPNVVLIFNKFTSRFGFDGEGSSFGKMLRGFNSFRDRIIDKNYSNVIFVFTHFCSETKALRRKPDSRLHQFKQIIENCTSFPKPIIITVAENKGRDQELPMVNGNYKLPNNEYYPKNLFEKMELVTTKGGDDVGLGVFRTAFRDSENFNVTSSSIIVDKGISFDVWHYMNILLNGSVRLGNSEISQLLQNTWNNSVDSSLKTQFPESLGYLQWCLYIKNIKTKDDIPRTTPEVLELFETIQSCAD